MRALEWEVERYGWVMSTAWAMKPLLRDVHTVDGMYLTVITLKMHQSFVQVSMNAILMDSVGCAYVSNIWGRKLPTGIVHILMLHVVNEAKFLLRPVRKL